MEKVIGITEFKLPKTVAALGNFDGIHKGHRVLIDKAKEIAKEKNIESALFAFKTHPSFVIQHKDPIDLIYNSEEKIKVLEDLNLDYYIEYPFNNEISNYEPEEFVKYIIINKLNADTIVVGEDYRFGKKRYGDIKLLEKLSKEYGFELIVMKKLQLTHREISSTWVREEIKKGNMEFVNELCGRRFFFLGRVVSGRKLGRELGFPTANIVPKNTKILPPKGVYVSKILIDEEEYYGLTNVGDKPTVNGEFTNVETHILNFNEDIYDKIIIVELFKYIRQEMKFNGLDSLVKQIKEDLATSKQYFEINDI
jgi:riboflavin kinase/FMN adenylyltransferase